MIASTPSGGTVHSPHAEITPRTSPRASLEQERDDMRLKDDGEESLKGTVHAKQ